MQANSLWAGNDYAYIQDKGNIDFSFGASRVRIIRVFKEKADSWNERLSTYAEVHFIDDEGNVKQRDGKDIIRKVRARDILDFWDSYSDEKERREQEARERQRKAIEEKTRTEAENLEMVDALASVGIFRGSITFDRNGAYLRINREGMREWMSKRNQPA